MMFFVSAKRLQAIIAKHIAVDRERQLDRIWKEIFTDDVRLRKERTKASVFAYPIAGEIKQPPTLTAIDQRVAAKKATTKAARPPRKPRDKK